MRPPTARPKRIARSTAPRFSTGSVPGSARSTALACVFGAAPNAVDAPEKIFDAVVSCAWVSRPMTISQVIVEVGSNALVESRRDARMPVGRLLIGVRGGEHARLVPVVADELQSHRQVARAEAARNRHP